MSTFIGQLIGFAVIVFIIAKWVAPLVKGLMVKQQEAIRVALAESAEAAKKLAEADAMHAKALADAEAEAGSVTGEAKQDSERIKAQREEQVHLLRQQLVRELRLGLGDEAVAKAADLVRAHVADSAAQAATVDRFLDDLDQMAPSAAVIETGATAGLRAASREALASLVS